MRYLSFIFFLFLFLPFVRADTIDSLSTARLELEQVKDTLRLSLERRERLSNEIDTLSQNRSILSKDLLSTSDRLSTLEQQITDDEYRLYVLLQVQENLRSSLLSKQLDLRTTLSALQKLGYNPPPALLVTPQSALTSLRSSSLLGSILPSLRAEAQILSEELNILTRNWSLITSRQDTLVKHLEDLLTEERRLTSLLSELSDKVANARTGLASEQLASDSLSFREESLNLLISSLEESSSPSSHLSESARLSSRLTSARSSLSRGERSALFGDSSTELLLNRLSSSGDISDYVPRVPFEDLHGTLLFPVVGRASYTDRSTISFQSRPSSLVRSPVSGSVVFAGEFRSYGHMIILNVGSGHLLVFSGMSRVNVRLGQLVLAGESLGRMGSDSSSLLNTVLNIEFRKDSMVIDSSPWWSQDLKEGL